MTTLTKPRSLLSLLWESFRLLGSFLTQVVVVEGGGLRAVYTRSSRLFIRAGWQWARMMGVLISLGELLSMEVGRFGRWAEVLRGLTNLLCIVGLTVLYWEMRGREERVDQREAEGE